jgi:hypothetical protein
MNNREEMQEEILELFRDIWQEAPELRFGQILENAFGHCNREKCIFYEGEERFIHSLKHFRYTVRKGNKQ